MAIARIEPTGCGEFHGNVKIRLAFYLELDDARYDKRHYLTPIIPESGYPGRVDKEGNPLDLEEYKLWEDSLPKKWVLAPFHNHFLYLPPDVTEDVIVSKANLHLPNFYAAWLQELDRIPGGMRKGWHIGTRQRPIRYDRTDPELYKLRKPQCLNKVALVKKLSLAIRSEGKGELFPSTEIDIGAAAINRGATAGYYTLIATENPANDTGTIDSVGIYAYNNLSNCEVATFEEVDTNTFTTRDSETLGTVTAPTDDTPQTFSGLDMDVTAGDYLGMYYSSGEMEIDTSGSGIWLVLDRADYIPCTSQEFYFLAGRTLSLYGTGETAAGPTAQAVGGATMSIASSLLKKTTISSGGATLSIAGSVAKGLWQIVGSGSVAIAGSLSTVVKYIQAVGSGAISIAGGLAKKASKLTGSASMTIAGTLLKKTSKSIGGDLGIIGSLATVKSIMRAVGGGTMAIAGTLLKKTSKLAGAGSMAIAGSLTRFTKKLVGAGSIASAGVLTAYKIFVKAVGSGSVAIAGVLTYTWRWLAKTFKFYSRAKTVFMYTWRKWVEK